MIIFTDDYFSAFRVTSTLNSNEPIARNTFIITRPTSSQKNFADDEDVLIKIILKK